LDAFEEIVADLLKEKGYWTSIGFKVDLPKERKVEFGKYSYPRPEIDILAYKPNRNALFWVECKSFLYYRGVLAKHLMEEDDTGKGLYKVFTWPSYRRIVSEELIKQVVKVGLSNPYPSINYCLVTGKIATQNDRELLHEIFNKKGWILWDENWVKEGLENLAMKGYENNVAIIVSKLFARKRIS
jgi:hypothetical protein